MLENHVHKLKKLKHTPCDPEPIQHGAKTQLTSIDITTPLNKEKKSHQQILGSLLYYARIIDLTMLISANDLTIESTKYVTTARNKMSTLIYYLAINPNTAMAHKKSDMMLKMYSDGSCLSATNARSRVAGHFYFGDDKNGNQNHREPNQGSMC